MNAGGYTRLVEALSGDARVRLIYGFGSTLRGEAGPRSDLDLAVLLNARPSEDEERELRAALAELAPAADLVILNDAPPALRFEVVTGGRCLLARDPVEQAEFELTSLSRFLDFQPVRRVQQEYLRARVKERRGPQDRSAS
jgi:predicted nucleotidyltransferase